MMAFILATALTMTCPDGQFYHSKERGCEVLRDSDHSSKAEMYRLRVKHKAQRKDLSEKQKAERSALKAQLKKA